MIQNFKNFLKLPKYQPLNLIEISKKNLLHNCKHLSTINRTVKIAPVLKSNAYGHGLVQIAKILDSGLRQNDRDNGIPFFCVDSIYEAYELLKNKIKTPILIMGYIDPKNLKVKKLPFKYAVFTLDVAQAIASHQPHAEIHIFVDTGMHREGVPVNELPEFLDQVKNLGLKIEGLMSHLASGDKPNDSLTKLQVKNFGKALEILKSYKIFPKYRHLANSDGLISRLSKFSTNVSRVGIALYGAPFNVIPAKAGLHANNNLLDPRLRGDDNWLKPVLAFKTKIIQIKKIKKGDRVGYDQTFTAKKTMTIGILPVGYFDGVDRRLSNKGWVTVSEIPCKIIGLVSMNITTIDLSKLANPYIGQEVVVYSNNPKDSNSISNASKICKTIPYDLLIHLASSTKRIIV